MKYHVTTTTELTEIYEVEADNEGEALKIYGCWDVVSKFYDNQQVTDIKAVDK